MDPILYPPAVSFYRLYHLHYYYYYYYCLTLHTQIDLARSQKKRSDKTKLWQERCREVRCQYLRRLDVPVYTFDAICLN